MCIVVFFAFVVHIAKWEYYQFVISNLTRLTHSLTPSLSLSSPLFRRCAIKTGFGAVVDMISFQQGRLKAYNEEAKSKLASAPSFLTFNCLPVIGDEVRTHAIDAVIDHLLCINVDVDLMQWW